METEENKKEEEKKEMVREKTQMVMMQQSTVIPQSPLIHVVDQIMSGGKTSQFIKLIDKQAQGARDSRYLIIVPLKTEIERYIRDCPHAHFVQPEPYYSTKYSKYVSKKNNLLRLLCNGDNIVTTHSLFGMFDEDIATEISRQGYQILIDEELTCIEPLDCTKGTREALIDSAYININLNTKRVRWSGPLEEDYDGPKEFIEVRKIILTKEVYIYSDKLFVFQTPPGFFSCAKDYTILTYRFEESSNMYLYFQTNGIKYQIFKRADSKAKKEFKELITMMPLPKSMENKKQRRTTYSGNYWRSRSSAELKKMRALIGKTLCRRDGITDKDTLLYACPKVVSSHKNSINGKHVTPEGYSGCWISYNIKATNDYAERDYMVYMQNVFFNVGVKKWLQENNTDMSEDDYALSVMIQCIWRVAIRNKKPIKLMVLSNRMRKLFLTWLNGEERKEDKFTNYCLPE